MMADSNPDHGPTDIERAFNLIVEIEEREEELDQVLEKARPLIETIEAYEAARAAPVRIDPGLARRVAELVAERFPRAWSRAKALGLVLAGGAGAQAVENGSVVGRVATGLGELLTALVPGL